MRLWMPFAALCGLLAACGGDDNDRVNPEQNYTLYQSSLERDRSPNVSDTEFDQLVQDNNQFSLELFHKLRNANGKDVVTSPISISTALAMTYAGAAGATKQQMAQALHFNLEDALLHSGFNRLTSTLSDLQLSATDESPALEVQIVNAIWPVEDMAPAQGFLDTLAVNYGEGVYAMDYRNAPDLSRRTINATVEDWTQGLITDLLPEGAINSLTELVLTNTIYLKAPWNSPFPEQATQPENFMNLDGSVSSVPTMSGQASVYHDAAEGAEVLILPFRGGALEMAFIVPDEGTFNNYLAEVDNIADITALLNAAPQTRASVQLPKFTQEFDSSLVEPMQALGMQDAFNSAADFTVMGLSDDFRITDIQHKAVFEVNESGVTAAAATAVVGGPTSVPIPVAVNQPFLYLIRDRTSGAIAFLGAVTHL